MAFFTRPSSSVSFLAPPFDNDDDELAATSAKLDDVKINGDASSSGHKSEPLTSEETHKPRLTSAQIAEQRLAQLRSHEVRNLTLAELQRLQHLTGDVHSRRLTLAELQKLQQQAPIVDSRHAELLKPRPVSSLVPHAQEPQPTAVTEAITKPAADSVKGNNNKIEFDYDLELGVEV